MSYRDTVGVCIDTVFVAYSGYKYAPYQG
jgi:hypothetical protein